MTYGTGELAALLSREGRGGSRKAPGGSDVSGTARISGGELFVKIDGSDLLTPCRTAAAVRDGDRVTARIASHAAVITGNLSDPAAGEAVTAAIVDGALDGFVVTNSNFIDGTISGSVFKDGTITGTQIAESTIDGSHIAQATFDEINGGAITAVEANIETILAGSATIADIEAETAKIENLTAEELSAATGYISDLETKNITTDDIQSATGYIGQLDAENITANDIKTATGYIGDLEAKNITADNISAAVGAFETIDADYAQIDFGNVDTANIQQAWIEQLMVQGKIIAKEGTIYYLDAVHINADNITTGTMKADRLLLSGENGLFYEINATVDGVTAIELSQEEYRNQLHGDKIIAKTITADKIDVADLNALQATIGGWFIKSDSIYSGSKDEFGKPEAVGVYLGSDGKFDLGSDNEYVRFDPVAGKLDISARALRLGSVDMAGALDEISNQLTANATAITQTGSMIEIGFIEIGDKLDENNKDWGELKSYIRFVDGNMELGKESNQFKAVLTNSELSFEDNGVKVSYINNQMMHITRAEVTDYLAINNWKWKQRSNGNMSLKWREGSI